jgi:glycosyltransferase involved in cell wall biosynthesis
MAAAYLNKSFKWGYFPEAIKMEANSLLEIKKNEYLRILWSGRFLEWKHPEKAIKVARALKNRNIPFKLTMIGDGQQKAKLIDYVLEYQLNDEVDFIGFITPEEVREYMLRSNIFLFTSDYNEGWGAVLNEAMSSGCAVVASHAAGSVPFLIKHEHNGIIYKNSNDKNLIDNIIRLAETPNLCLKYGLAAYRTITETWNAANAAKNFITLSQSLLEGKIPSIVEGPGSRANPIKQWDMYKTIVNMSK